MGSNEKNFSSQYGVSSARGIVRVRSTATESGRYAANRETV